MSRMDVLHRDLWRRWTLKGAYRLREAEDE
jgi:hypothetical protein